MTQIHLDDSLTKEAQEAYKAVVNEGFFWNLSMSQEGTYAGIRRKALSHTVMLIQVGPNALSEAILKAYDEFLIAGWIRSTR